MHNCDITRAGGGLVTGTRRKYQERNKHKQRTVTHAFVQRHTETLHLYLVGKMIKHGGINDDA